MSKRKSRPRRKSPSSNNHTALVDVVMPFFGETVLAEKAALSVPGACGDIPYELIIVDNGTPNQEGRAFLEQLKAKGVEFRSHWLKHNMGYPGGVDAGVQVGRAPLIFVLTADVVLDEGVIKAAVEEMDNPDVGVVGTKLVFPENSPHGPAGMIQHAGLAMNLAANVFHIFMGWSADHPKVNQRREMYAVTGAAFMTRRNLFMKVGGLSQAYGLGTFEDVEYCIRIREAGKKVIFNPSVSGTHFVGGAMIEGANKEGFDLQRNQQLFMSRCGHALSWDEWRFW